MLSTPGASDVLPAIVKDKSFALWHSLWRG
jgi:hypothetical protein